MNVTAIRLERRGLVDGHTAECRGLIHRAVPEDRLATEVGALANRTAPLPVNRLVIMKRLVNQTYEKMGLRTGQMIGTLINGIACRTPAGIARRELTLRQGVTAASTERDGSFDDDGARKK